MRAKIIIPKLKYKPGDFLEIELDLNQALELLENLSNTNIAVTSLGDKRNELVISFSTGLNLKDGKLIVRQKLPENKDYGVCYISYIKLFYNEAMDRKIDLLPQIDFPLTFFWVTEKEVTDDDQRHLLAEVEEILNRRKEYTNKLLITDKASRDHGSAKDYHILIFAVGLHISSTQQLEGYSIIPLNMGFDYQHMRLVVSDYAEKTYKFDLPYEEVIGREFKNSTPTMVIDIKNIHAVDEDDAIKYSFKLSDDLFTIMAFDEGIRPNPFASIIINQKNKQVKYSFHFPGYSGNIIAPFDIAKTAHQIERLRPLSLRSPWFNLLLRSYGDAVREKDVNFIFLKLWATLEYIGNRRVQEKDIVISSSDGEAIKNTKGKKITTKHSLGKVYWWVYNNCPPSHTFTSKDKGLEWKFEMAEKLSLQEKSNLKVEIISLWDCLSAVYEIRNQTAHKGTYNPREINENSEREKLAARLFTTEGEWLLSVFKSIVKHIINIELDEPDVDLSVT